MMYLPKMTSHKVATTSESPVFQVKILFLILYYGLKKGTGNIESLQQIFIFCNNFILFLKFIYFWLRWVFVAVRGLSLVAASGGYSSLWWAGFSLRWLLLLRSMGSRCMGFSSCGTWVQQLWLAGSRVQAQQLWHMGLVAPQHVGSSWTRA